MKVKYKNWSINKKLLSISLSAFLPMVILAAYLIVSLNNAASAYSEITKSIAYANRYVKDFKSRLDYSVYLAVVSNKQLKEVRDGVTTARVGGLDDAQFVPIYTFGDVSKLTLK